MRVALVFVFQMTFPPEIDWHASESRERERERKWERKRNKRYHSLIIQDIVDGSILFLFFFYSFSPLSLSPSHFCPITEFKSLPGSPVSLCHAIFWDIKNNSLVLLLVLLHRSCSGSWSYHVFDEYIHRLGSKNGQYHFDFTALWPFKSDPSNVLTMFKFVSKSNFPCFWFTVAYCKWV